MSKALARIHGPDVPGQVLDIMRTYLGDKLRIPGAALTFGDVRDLLPVRGVDDKAIQALNQLFETCEAGVYAGGANAAAPAILPGQALELARQLERVLR